MKNIFPFIVVFLLSTKAVFGQDMLTATLANQQIHDFQRERIRSEYENEKARLKEGKNNGTLKSTARTPADAKSFLFTPNSEISAKVKKAIIDNEKKRNPGTKLGEALNDKNNPFPGYVRLLKTLGLDVQHNYADAFTAYLLGMWRIANRLSNNPTSGQIKNTRDQISATLDISKWDNVKKQEATEYLIYDLIFANEPYEGSRKDNDKKQLQQDSDAVYNRFLKQNKLDLRKMEITENGLVKTK